MAMTRHGSTPVDVSAELSKLKYPTKQNNKLPKLPTNTTIERRPINHAPIASHFAGSKVDKVVYVSRKTPVISAVKRVKKYLREIERRALQSGGVASVLDRGGRNVDQDLHRKLDEVSEKLKRDAEEVLVKASGRAIEQALRVAEWFKSREDEVTTNVEIRTGSVSVVDDIVEKVGDDRDVDDGGMQSEAKEGNQQGSKEITQHADTALEAGHTTIELLGNLENRPDQAISGNAEHQKAGEPAVDEVEQVQKVNGKDDSSVSKKRKRKQRKEYDPDDLPEARLRWVKTVEVAISLRP